MQWKGEKIERVMTDHFAERTAKANRSWLPQRKIYNSFSRSYDMDMTNSKIFSRGKLNPEIENTKIIL